ncbi:enoyl-CoA hydratase/isomerase family protein [Paraflavisolibacter sp. H34]|uniref:enoyl-CoA hydratase/isomerase family protein n=1 Tax=Huijunlia imazamoxiresistens TaxID=3127457 RepID=UPI003017988F
MASEINKGYVRTETHNSITTIEFYHPQSNSLPRALLEELAREIHTSGRDNDTGVIVLRSAGEKTFCAGASFDELATIQTPEKGFDFFSGFATLINSIRTCPRMVIGRIHGRCVGGGVGLAAAVDYAIAHANASVRLSELEIGMGPFVVGPAIERKIGLSAFSQLAIDASQERTAEWAHKRGLYAEVHASTEDLDEAVRRLANRLVHSSRQAIVELKKVMWSGTEDWDDLLRRRAEISGRLVLTQFTKDVLARIRAKKV